MPVSTLADFTASNHEYTFSRHTAVGNSTHWLHLSTFPPVEDTLPRIPQGSSKPDKTTRPWMPVHILTIMYLIKPWIDFSEPNTVAPSDVLLTDFTWTTFHPWKLIYQDPEGSSTPGKPVLPIRQVNVLAIYTESNHECRLSDPTAVVHSADWLQLNTFPYEEDALLSTRRLLKNMENRFCH